MASLIEVRDMLALQGRMEANQLSHALHLSRPMVDAMLARMEAMGKAVRIRKRLIVVSAVSVKRVRKGNRPASVNGGH